MQLCTPFAARVAQPDPRLRPRSPPRAVATSDSESDSEDFLSTEREKRGVRTRDRVRPQTPALLPGPGATRPWNGQLRHSQSSVTPRASWQDAGQGPGPGSSRPGRPVPAVSRTFGPELVLAQNIGPGGRPSSCFQKSVAEFRWPSVCSERAGGTWRDIAEELPNGGQTRATSQSLSPPGRRALFQTPSGQVYKY